MMFSRGDYAGAREEEEEEEEEERPGEGGSVKGHGH